MQRTVNLSKYVGAKNDKNRMKFDKATAKIKRHSLFALHLCRIVISVWNSHISLIHPSGLNVGIERAILLNVRVLPIYSLCKKVALI